MLCYNDRTYCASENCTGQCGRKMTPKEIVASANSAFPVCWAYFCDDNGLKMDGN